MARAWEFWADDYCLGCLCGIDRPNGVSTSREGQLDLRKSSMSSWRFTVSQAVSSEMAQTLATDLSISVYDSSIFCNVLLSRSFSFFKVAIKPRYETGVVCKTDYSFGISSYWISPSTHAPSDWLSAVHRDSEWSLSRLQLLLI